MAPTSIDGSDITGATIDGQDVSEITVDGQTVFEAGPDIPDSGVYLHDDWGDNKLQNRDDSVTVTYNGVTGTYRPEWTLVSSNPEATSQELSLTDNDALHAALPDIRNKSTTFEVNDLSGSLPFVRISIWGTSTSHRDSDKADIYAESYFVDIQQGFDVFRLRRQAGLAGSPTDVINADQSFSLPIDVRVEHDGSGGWELFLNGVSQGTATDTTYTDTEPILWGFSDVRNPTTVNEIKVS